MSLQWLQQQRATPSFATVSGAVDQLHSALDQPLPAALHPYGDGAADYSMSAIADELHSPRAARISSPRNADAVLSPRRARSAGGAYTSQVVDSRGIKKQINVFESLVERGKLSAESKDKQRIEAAKQEMRRCRSVPKINRLTEDAVAPTTSIFQRLYNKEMEKQARHHTTILIMKKKEDEMFSTLFQPRISNKGHRSKGIAGSATSSDKYSFKTLQRMDEIRKEKIMKEMETMMDAPDINPKSSTLALKQREREGMAGYSHIEAMIERDRLSKLARYEQKERELIAQHPGTPRITEYAAGLSRGSESTHERLFRSYSTKREKTEQLSSIYTPNRHKTDVSEFTSLAHHESGTRLRKDEKIRSILEAERHVHAPTINPVSASIAARLPTTTDERLSATPRRATTTLSNGQDSVAKKDSVSTPSERDIQLFERLRIAEARRKLRVDSARNELNQRRAEECSFSPVTTTGYYPPPRHGGEDVYQRSSDWQQVRDDRIRQQKQMQGEASQKELTFQPTISRKTQEMFEAGSLYSAPKSDTALVSGFESFIDRQKKARDIAPKTTDPTDVNYSWDSSTTVNKHSNPIGAIASIRRPVEAPLARRATDHSVRPVAYDEDSSTIVERAFGHPYE